MGLGDLVYECMARHTSKDVVLPPAGEHEHAVNFAVLQELQKKEHTSSCE